MRRGCAVGRWRRRAVAVACLTFKADVASGHATELPYVAFPSEGSSKPSTYSADSGVVDCTALDPYPSAVLRPFNPTIGEALEFCSTRFDCGGVVFWSSAAISAGGGGTYAPAKYCQPQSFVSGPATTSTGVAFMRQKYHSCDVTVPLAATTTTVNGDLTWTRSACVRPGRGLASASRERSPRPGRVKRKSRPNTFIEIGGASYQFGKEVFIDQASAESASADGSVHTNVAASGATYYMPGLTHSVWEQYMAPIALDGYSPLYNSSAAASAASSRAGGNGQFVTVGPASSVGSPARWSQEPRYQLYYMPADGVTSYYGTYVTPIALDGYYPLYETEAAALAASSSNTAQSHGPSSTTGHPLRWSSGQKRVYYMPSEGPTKYYGDYFVAEAGPPTGADLYGATLLPAALQGNSDVAASAAQAYVAGNSGGFVGVR